MRILLSPESKKELYNFLKTRYNCDSGRLLSLKIKVPYGTLKNWFQEKERYLPEKIIPPEIKLKLNILDEQNDNWGILKGGRNSYKSIIKKYGISEIRKRQSNGGKKSTRLRREMEPPINNEIISNPLFLEFYGALLGDGWLSKLKYKNKNINLIGVSGHRINDKDFHLYLKGIIRLLFNRNPYLKEIFRYNAREMLFCHANLFNFLNKELGFPIGRKINLNLNEKIIKMGFEKIRYIIRGIFDTDGCFYLDKTPANKPYPCISITMKEPLLMGQIYSVLIDQGFKVYHYKSEKIEKLFLKGSKQLRKWMNEIGSSNPYKSQRMKKALMAQLDSATDS